MSKDVQRRRSARSVVLEKERKGEARVMSYEDLSEARAKRVAKDKTKEAKGKTKRGCPLKKWSQNHRGL
jgi:hypothetical protein